jgi:hypothetical protein
MVPLCQRLENEEGTSLSDTEKEMLPLVETWTLCRMSVSHPPLASSGSGSLCSHTVRKEALKHSDLSIEFKIVCPNRGA